MTTLVDADPGRVLEVVDGQDSAGIGAWLAARSQTWRNAVEVVAIDPSAAFRQAIPEQLPQTAVSVDAFHLAKLGNDMVTRVRQQVTRETKGRRRHGRDPAAAATRRGLPAPTGPDPPDGDPRGRRPDRRDRHRRGRLQPPTREEAAQRHTTLRRRRHHGDARNRPTPRNRDRGVTSHRGPDRHRRHQRPTETANTSIKQTKRTGRGHRNPTHYRTPILLASTTQTAT